MRANAGRDSSWNEERCNRLLKGVDQRIESLLAECEQTDAEEEGSSSFVKLKEGLEKGEVLKSKVKEIMRELKESNRTSLNVTDKECRFVKSAREGSFPGYNVQSVVDEKHGLIVNVDIVDAGADSRQLTSQVEQAEEALGRQCSIACADAGYSSIGEMKKLSEKDVQVIVPSLKQAANKKASPFDRENFSYDRERDCYICPEGETLEYAQTKEEIKVYKIKKGGVCQACPSFSLCTVNKRGRSVARHIYQEIREKQEAEYLRPESQAIYRQRKQRVEHPFGHIKENLKARRFLLRGMEGVRAEIKILATCFNLRRMITLLGVREFREKVSV